MKKNLEQHIADLLQRYDLVTVPGFGTFVAKRKPAYYAEEDHSFFPPSKDLTFNLRLRTDDGLLSDSIARRENMTRAEARRLIDHITDEWVASLNRHGHLYLDPLGSFVFHDGKLRFISAPGINFLPEAFGLHPVVRRPVEKHETLLTSIPKTKTPVNTLPTSRKLSVKRTVMTAAAALLIAGSVAWTFMHFGSASMSGTETVQQASYTLEATFPPVKIHPVKKAVNETLTQDNRTAGTEVQGPTYYLIAGAFGQEANARKLMERLAAEGYTPVEAGTNAKGLHLVAIAAYKDAGEAQKAKQELRAAGKEVWILTKG